MSDDAMMALPSNAESAIESSPIIAPKMLMESSGALEPNAKKVALAASGVSASSSQIDSRAGTSQSSQTMASAHNR